MRGKISDQDLTDYALNELEPAQRLYVESMLAVSEECRNDVYEMIDLAMLLDQGFEREEAGQVAGELRPEQRAALDVQPGDVIRSVDGRPIQSSDDWQEIDDVLSSGGSITVGIERQGSLQSVSMEGARLANQEPPA